MPRQQHKHKDVSFVVERSRDGRGGGNGWFESWPEAAAFALGLAVKKGDAFLCVVVTSEPGAEWFAGTQGKERYRSDPDSAYLYRFEVKAEDVTEGH